jgi:signal transduction histidine kinase
MLYLVIDTGKGIDSRYKYKVFDKFFQIQEAVKEQVWD